MMDEGADSPLRSDLTGQQFQQQLNRWFEQYGVLDNLRSHLRSLMIAALQHTEIGMKPKVNTSPKAQAVDLVVAEHLLKRGCHYTLSILMSEVPFLGNFGSGSIFRRCKSKSKCLDVKHHFQENEVMEILNALGMASSEERIQVMYNHYVENREEESLLESLLLLLSKSQLKQNTASYETESQNRLSKEWSIQVSDLFLKIRENPSQIPTTKELLSKITENEIRRIVEEESKKQMMLLVQRERKIQEYLKNKEDEIMDRLQHAEKELDTRREIIDKELMERQLHLKRIAFHWKDKHNEIMALSKNFAVVKRENKALTAKIDEMEAEIKELKLEIKKKAEVAERLEAEKTSFKCRMQECLRWKSKRRSERGIKDFNKPTNADPSIATERLESDSSDCEKPPSEFLSLEEVVAKAKSRIQILEEENTQISENYFKYRRKYEHTIGTDSEELKSDVSSAAEEECENPLKIEDKEIDVTPEPGKRERPRLEEVNREAVAVNTSAAAAAAAGIIQVALPVSEADVLPKGLTPTKRQQKDHEYYLKSRNLLEILEKSSGIVDAYGSDTTSDISMPCSHSNDSSERKEEKAMKGSYLPAAVETLPIHSEKDTKEYGRDHVVGVSDLECLAILRKATHCSSNLEKGKNAADEEHASGDLS